MWRMLILLFISVSVNGSEWTESATIEKRFIESNVSGAFVIYDRRNDLYVIHNTGRAKKRFMPASTFKITNALIGLSLGVVETVHEVLPYGGSPQRVKSWEKDMGLKDAIKVSNLPVFQELARRIGVKQMQLAIEKLSYGNASIGSEVDRFWIDGPLKISAVEQAEFLTKLAESELSLPLNVQQSVREILQLESSGDCRLYAKTGWTNMTDPDIGWWVGWIDNNGHIVSFALNMDMPVKSAGKKRISLGKNVLSDLGLWPCE